MTPVNQKKSDRTRGVIIEAARRLFREHGYERTTVRDIAAEASIDPALVIRYFGSKDQLFVHAADIRLELPDLSAVDRSKVGTVLASHFMRIWESDGSNSGLPILLRSAASNEVAAELMRDIFGKQVAPRLQALGSGAEAQERAALVSSQLLGVALCRYILRLPPIVAMPVDQLAQAVGATIQRYLAGVLAAND